MQRNLVSFILNKSVNLTEIAQVFFFLLLQSPYHQATLEMATTLLTLPTPNSVLQQTKSLLASLFPTKAAYHNHRVSM